MDVFKKSLITLWLCVTIRYQLVWKRCSVQSVVNLADGAACLHVAFSNEKMLSLKHIALAVLKQSYISIKTKFAQCSQAKEKFSVTDKVPSKLLLSSFSPWLGLCSLVHECCIICYFEIAVLGKVLNSCVLMSVTIIYFSLKSKHCLWVDASF